MFNYFDAISSQRKRRTDRQTDKANIISIPKPLCKPCYLWTMSC